MFVPNEGNSLILINSKLTPYIDSKFNLNVVETVSESNNSDMAINSNPSAYKTTKTFIFKTLKYYYYYFYHNRLQHPNLLPLLGYTCNQSTLCLVYPYMVLGSLDKHLSRLDLGSRERLKILQDIASGLHYLHTGCGEVLVHRDVKR